MTISIQHGARLDEALVRAVQQVGRDASNARSLTTQQKRADAYRRVTQDALRALRASLPTDELDALVTTQTYWSLMSGGLSPAVLFDAELDELVVRCELFVKAAHEEISRWERSGRVLVPDTNVLVHVLKDKPIRDADWRHLARLEAAEPLTIVLLQKVADELDVQKARGHDSVKTRARKLLREINAILEEAPPPASLGSDIRLEVLVPRLGHQSLPDADSEIVDQVARLQGLLPRPHKPLLMTNDTGMVFRARFAADVEAIHVEQDNS